MINPELERYVQAAREKHASDEAIKSALMTAGWSEGDVLSALMPAPIASNTSAFLPPAPAAPTLAAKGQSSDMWIAFEYILLFVSLLTFSVSLAGIFHYGVDNAFKDPATYYPSFGSGFVQYYLAAIIVSFPIFAALFLMLRKKTLKFPAIKDLRIRKILVYIALVWTFIAMLVRVIRIVYAFLQGAATVNSLMHLLVTLVVSGGIFAYFIFDVRADHKNQ